MPNIPNVTLSFSDHQALVRLSHLESTPERPPERLFYHGLVSESISGLNENGYPVSFSYSISAAGREYLRQYRMIRFDVRLNRVLAVAALLISLFALLLEFQDRGIIPPFPTPVSVEEQLAPETTPPLSPAKPA